MADSGASLIKFSTLCNVFETTRELKKQEKTNALTNFIKRYREQAEALKHSNPNANVSFYPVLRLLLPQNERDRGSYGLKEVTLAKRFIKILCLPHNGADAEKLTNFRISTDNTNYKDFADAAYWVLRKHFVDGSKLTIVDVNNYLDAIAQKHTDNDPRGVDGVIYKLFQQSSAEEQKWLIRIILKDLWLGISQDRILNCYHPDAADLYSANGSLSKVCDTLIDPLIRLHEIEVSLFAPFRPMLSQRCDLSQFNKVFSGNVQLYIETKFDGERFQLHMQNNHFQYFSRNGYDYTNTYGENFLTGLYTPKLKNAFKPHVKSIILDGEMMGWNSVTRKFGSKGMDFDVKHLKTDSVHQPCFCVFDILLLNGVVLTGKPLRERILLLSTILTPVQGVIAISSYTITDCKIDVINALNLSMDDELEGIVLKDANSLYKSNNRNAGWWKMKLEYFENVMSDLDVIVMGGYYGDGKNMTRISGFLVGVAVPAAAGQPTTSYLSLARVSSGLSNEELDIIDKNLGPYWKKIKEGDPENHGLQWGKDKPDVWIQPDKSCIIQIRASELVRLHSLDFKTDYTLRFPRIQQIRLDKPYYDCLTITEFQDLTSSSAVKKLTRRHLELSDLEPPQKKGKGRRKTVHVPIPCVEKKSDLLEGYEFYVLSGENGWKTKEEVEVLIRENGGTVVLQEGSNTLCMLIGDFHPRLNAFEKFGVQVDVVKLKWLREVLETNIFKLYTPKVMVHSSQETIDTFLGQYCESGDSYTEDIDPEDLQGLLLKNSEFAMLSSKEINELEKEANVSHPINLFRDNIAYFDRLGKDYKVLNPPESPTMVDEIDFRFLGGTISHIINRNINLVIMDDKSDNQRKKEILQFLAQIDNRVAKIVPKQYIYTTLEECKRKL